MSKTHFSESAREVSVVEHGDVIVAGGGPAGVAGAVAACEGQLPHALPWPKIKTQLDELVSACKGVGTA